MFFSRKHLRLTIEGKKTATRRTSGRHHVGHTEAIRCWIFEKGLARIRILRKYRQRLGDMTEEDARKEGGYTLAEFPAAWREIYGHESWDPAKEVWVYEYKLVPGSLVNRAGRCVLCGSSRVHPHFGITEYAFSECEDCGAVYNGQGELTSPEIAIEARP